MKTMTVKEAKRAIRNCDKVFGYVAFNEDHGDYIQMVKSDLLAMLANFDLDYEVKASIENNDLYVN